MRMTLPSDSAERKKYPVLSGFVKYFPAAIAEVARISHEGNEKHNPGQELHWARGKSTDHGDCIIRHTIDLEDLKSVIATGFVVREVVDMAIAEAACRAWRAMAELQELCEVHKGAPTAPGVKYDIT